MPVYKVTHVGKTDITLEADRVVSTGDYVRFERLAPEGAWKRVLQMPASSVRSVRRRVLEVGGARHFAPTEPLSVPAPPRRRWIVADRDDIDKIVERALRHGPRDHDEIVSFASAGGANPRVITALRALPPGTYRTAAEVRPFLPPVRAAS
ncbi:DUF2795 domain-containing protein [Georgenia daeguensis]|uniref:DUF2795 domain-containing protein n=1 Tax=Georgenia daeguensis TaxID=908355 RepID=A0ABP8EYI3_9MICO